MNNNTLKMLAEKNAPVYTWESGIKTTTAATLEFYENNKEFYVVKSKDNKIKFFSLDGDLKLVTSPVIRMEKHRGYVCIETANSVYQLWQKNYGKPVVHEDAHVTACRASDELTRMLDKMYPIESAYMSRCSLFQAGLRDEAITDEEFRAARDYYGRLWNYVGD